jgi:hypothetical protein
VKDFRPAIRRALKRVCGFDFLARFEPLNISQSSRIRLILRGQSITALAGKLGFDRASVSLTIHGRRRMPKVEAAIRKELGL